MGCASRPRATSACVPPSCRHCMHTDMSRQGCFLAPCQACNFPKTQPLHDGDVRSHWPAAAKLDQTKQPLQEGRGQVGCTSGFCEQQATKKFPCQQGCISNAMGAAGSHRECSLRRIWRPHHSQPLTLTAAQLTHRRACKRGSVPGSPSRR